MKDKLEKIRDNAHYAYRQLGVWQSSSAEDTKAIQKLKECITLADSIIAELDSPDLVEKVVYQHYKGGYYNLLCFGKYESSGQNMVVYQCQESKQIYIRPEVEFHNKFTKTRKPQSTL